MRPRKQTYTSVQRQTQSEEEELVCARDIRGALLFLGFTSLSSVRGIGPAEDRAGWKTQITKQAYADPQEVGTKSRRGRSCFASRRRGARAVRPGDEKKNALHGNDATSSNYQLQRVKGMPAGGKAASLGDMPFHGSRGGGEIGGKGTCHLPS